MNTHNGFGRVGGAFICALIGAAALQAQVGIYGIGDLAGGDNYSEVRSAILTSNGIVAVGHSIGQSWNTSAAAVDAGAAGAAGDTAVLWTKGSGAGVLQALPPIVAPNIDNIGRLVSAGDVTEVSTGNLVIVARSYYGDTHPNAKEQVLYTYSFNGTTATYGTTTPLLTLASGNISQFGQNAATAVSRDGTVVYGFSQISGANNSSTRWTVGTGLVDLGLIPSDTSNIPAARGVSSDGSVMVGTRTLTGGTTTNAFIYSSTSGYTTIGTLGGGNTSQALAVSADGTKVFGTSGSTAHPNGEAFFWTSGGGFTALGTPNDAWTPNNFGGITADGSAAIMAFDTGSAAATYLFNNHGIFDLATVLAAGGVDSTGWTNLGVEGMSPDGQLIYGSGTYDGYTQGFVAEVPLGLVSSIPEPSTYGMLGGLAALGLAVIARRKRAS